MDAGRPLVDWRSAEPYAVLARCDRHAFAWEWLRRSPVYRDCDAGLERLANGYGLCRFVSPAHGVPLARPIWRADADPAVVVAAAHSDSGGFDFAKLGAIASLAVGEGGSEHWLWSDGIRHVRLDITAGSLQRGPVCLDYQIAGCASTWPQVTTLMRLIALMRTGRLVRRLFAPEHRASRWALVLRAHDALVAGASQQDIAEHVLGMAPTVRWRLEAPSWRQRANRLIGAARAAARVDPRLWLSGSFP